MSTIARLCRGNCAFLLHLSQSLRTSALVLRQIRLCFSYVCLEVLKCERMRGCTCQQTLWPCFIIDKGRVIDIKKQILNFILIDTEILLVKFDKGQL
jgi:hypothetical protein